MSFERMESGAGRSGTDPQRDSLEFRLVEATDITDDVAAEMLAIFHASFPRWPNLDDPDVLDRDYLRWKMSGPATTLGSYQGRLGKRLVYATVVFASWVRVGGIRRLRLTFLDASVDPAARGAGIFSQAVQHQDTLRYRCDFSMHERSSAAKVRRRLRRNDRRPLGNHVKVLSRVLVATGPPTEHRGLRRVPVIAASFSSWAWSAMLAATRRKSPAQPRDTARIDERFDVLFASVASGFDMIAERTADFLRWRYGDRRAGRYFFRELTEQERLVGYCVSRVAGPRAYIADLLAVPGRRDVVETLVADAVELATTAGATMIDCWLPRRHPYRRALWRQGFFDRRDAGVSYHPVEASAEDLAPLGDERARIHYTLGDTDLV